MTINNGGSDQRGNAPEEQPQPAQGIGNRIKAAADAVGSRKEAARLAGVSDDMLYRYMREETPPRFEAIVRLAYAAGMSLDWMASGSEKPTARESSGRYDVAPEWAQSRVREIDALLAAQGELPLPPTRVAANETLQSALTDLRRIARLPTVPHELRVAAARAGSVGFGDQELAHLHGLAEHPVSQQSGQRLAEVADELEAAIRESDYRPPDLILDGFKTAMYVNGMPRAAAVTLLRFLDAHERKEQQ